MRYLTTLIPYFWCKDAGSDKQRKCLFGEYGKTYGDWSLFLDE
jgi:hypothetical protein